MLIIKNNKDFFLLISLVVIAFISVYFLPSLVSKTLFLFILPLVWKSKKDYLWFAFIIILISEPGGFFSGGLRSDAYRLPIYSFGMTISFSIIELYFISLLIKFIFIGNSKKKKPYIFFRNELHLLFSLFILLVVISFFLGTSFDSVRNIYKTFLNLTLFYTVFYIISDQDDLIRFFRLLFPFVFVAIIFQVYGLIIGYKPVEIFKPGSVRNLYGTLDSLNRRPIEMASLLFICFTGSLYLIGNVKSSIKPSFLILVNGTSFLSIFLTGTRAWFFAFTLGYIYYFLLIKRIRISDRLLKFGIIAILITLVTVYIPTINMQIHNAWTRISTIQYLAEGDLSLGQTASRYTDYAPEILEKFSKSTVIFGAAFSDYYYDNANIHVGYHNHLFNVGLVGIIVFALVILKILFTSFFSKKRSLVTKIALLPLLLLMIINTSVQVIGYGVIHSNFFILQAYALALLVIAYNLKPVPIK